MRQFALVIVLALLFTIKALAATYYVDINRAPGGNGTSWAQATNDLVGLLNTPNLFAIGDEIHIAQGTYNPGDGPQTTFDLTEDHIGISIRGGYQGGTTDPGLRDIELFPTILSGNGGTVPSLHVVTITGLYNDEDDAILFDGVTIRDGAATNGMDDNLLGAGALVFDARVNFLRCTFRNNSALESGGGLYFEDSGFKPGGHPPFDLRARLANCRFIMNNGKLGGGLANVGGEIEQANCLFLQDDASVPDGPSEGEGNGAGLYNSDDGDTRQKIARLYNCTYFLNTSDNTTSAFSDQSILAYNCIFWDGEDSFVAVMGMGDSMDVQYSTAGNAAVLDGEGNTNDDPQLDSEGRPCPTNMVAINSGDESLLPLDWLDLDDDIPSQTQPLPLDIVNSGRVWPEGLLDRGAYERVDIIECVGDVDHNDVVDTDDLLALLGSWGPCSGCPADFAPCPLNGIVDTDDLLALFGNWGECGGSMMMFGGGGGGGVPQSIQDCIDAAIENGLEGVEFAEFIQQCIENL